MAGRLAADNDTGCKPLRAGRFRHRGCRRWGQMNIVGPVGGGATDSLPVRRARFTYLDYLELRGWEFEKFRHLPTITQEQIAAVNWPVLARMFAGEDAET